MNRHSTNELAVTAITFMVHVMFLTLHDSRIYLVVMAITLNGSVTAITLVGVCLAFCASACTIFLNLFFKSEIPSKFSCPQKN